MHCVAHRVRRTGNDGARSALVGECPCRLGGVRIRLEFHLKIYSSIRTWRGRCRWGHGRGHWSGTSDNIIDRSQGASEGKGYRIIHNGIPDLSRIPGWIGGTNCCGNASNICVWKENVRMQIIVNVRRRPLFSTTWNNR